VWGTVTIRDNIVWGSSLDADTGNIVWGTTVLENFDDSVWGTTGRRIHVAAPTQRR
jgi:hypothetical protein